MLLTFSLCGARLRTGSFVSKTSRRFLRPTQPPLRWIPGHRFLGVDHIAHLRLVPRFRTCRCCTSISPVRLRDVPRNNFTFKVCFNIIMILGDRSSVVGIATCYGLDGTGIKSRCGARFSAPVPTGPGAHPVSCTVGTGSLSQG